MEFELNEIPADFAKPRHKVYFRLFSAAHRCVGRSGLTELEQIDNLKLIRAEIQDAVDMMDAEIAQKEALLMIQLNFDQTAEEPTLP